MDKDKYILGVLICLIVIVIVFTLCFMSGCNSMPSKKPIMETGEVTRTPSGYEDWKERTKE